MIDVSIVEASYVNRDASLPYGVTVTDVIDALDDAYAYFLGLEEWHSKNGYGSFVDALRAHNGLSDFVGNVITRSIATHSDELCHNEMQDGHPDLLPTSEYDSYAKRRADEGIETKCSMSAGSWDAHSYVDGHVLVVRYRKGGATGVEVVQLLCAALSDDDWNYSGTDRDRRRTATATVNRSGMHKLRSNPIYENPDYIVQNQREDEYRKNHAEFDENYDV